jgi:hypothetical protein
MLCVFSCHSVHISNKERLTGGKKERKSFLLFLYHAKYTDEGLSIRGGNNFFNLKKQLVFE